MRIAGGGGVGGAFVSKENAERDAALAYQGRAGVSLEMGTGFTADFEYIYLRTNELEFGPSADEFTAEGPFGRAATGDGSLLSKDWLELFNRTNE